MENVNKAMCCKRAAVNGTVSPDPKKFTVIRTDLPSTKNLSSNLFSTLNDRNAQDINNFLNDSFGFGDFDDMFGNFPSSSLPCDEEKVSFETKDDDRSMKSFLQNLKSIDVIVENVFKREDEVVVLARSACCDYRLILRDFWSYTELCLNDRCRIFISADDHSQTDSNRTVVFDNNSESFVLIKPDLLLSSTFITSAVFCRRKAILNEKFHILDNSNKAMLVGSIVHEIFQKALLEDISDMQQLKLLAKRSLSDLHFVEATYFSSLTDSVLMEELHSYLPQICKLIENKFSKKYPLYEQQQPPAPNFRFEKVYDIEENIWSPKYGIRGKVDLTIEVSAVEVQSKKYVLPVELKTGRVTHSAEHKGQVILYNAMLSELYSKKASKFGALLYLKDQNIQNIELKPKEFHGLLRLRNDLAYYLDGFGNGDELFRLPDGIESEKFCKKCPQLFNCCLFQRLSQDSSSNKNENNFWSNLVKSSLSHLTDEDFQYVRKWLKWICLENNEQYKQKRLSDIWNVSSKESCRISEGCSYLIICGNSLLENRVLYDTVIEMEGFGETCREARGEALFDLQVVDQFTNGTTGRTDITLARNNVLSVGVFDVGDFAILTNETDGHVAVAMGTIAYVDEKTIKLIIDKKLIYKPNDFFRLDQYNNGSTLLKVNLGSLTRLFEHSNSWLRQLIIYNQPPSFCRKVLQSEIEVSKAYLKQLNKEQVLAILKVLRAEHYVLIKGLPGSGKTSAICALTEILVALNKSVLITSYTHSAVDNILLKLCKTFTKILRLGTKSQVHSDCQRFLLENYLTVDGGQGSVETLKYLFENTPVVAATCTTVAMHQLFGNRRFDVVIVDEATLLHEASCLAPLFCADKFVLVGDSQQLQPLVVSKVCKSEGMAQSLFDRLEQNHPDAVVLLNKQYRMNREISKLSDSLFYNGRLICADETVARNYLPTLKLSLTTPCWLQFCLSSSPENAVLFLDTKNVAEYRSIRKGPGQLKNDVEADLICRTLEAFLQAGFNGETMGVISPYRYQCKIIRDQLCNKLVEVNTIDKYQGRDKNIVLVSFVWTVSCSSSSEQEKPSDLLMDPRRVNVMLTRAKQKLILIGCKDDLCRTYEWICKLCQCLNENQIVLL